MDRATRCCPTCKVKWVHKNLTNRECPRCGIGSFFTMNLGDVGTAVYFENSGDDIDNYQFIKSE